MDARNALRLAAGALPALALTLWACGSEPAPPSDPAEAEPPAAGTPEPAPGLEPMSAMPSEPIDPNRPFVPGQALPDGFPDDLPLPDDASFVGSFARGGMAAQWRSPRSTPELADELRGLFEASSAWKFEAMQEAGPERLLTATRGTTGLIAAMVPVAGGGSDINVYVIDISEGPQFPPEVTRQIEEERQQP